MRKLLYAATALGALAIASPASAGLVAEYSTDGGATFTGICTDVSGGNCGSTFTSTNGLDFTIFGATSNSPGTAVNAHVLQATVELSNPTATAQTILVRVGDTGFTAPVGSVDLLNNIAGTVVVGGAGNAFNSIACVDQANGQNVCPGGTTDSAIIFANITAPGTGSNSNTTPIASLSSPYALTELLSISLDAGADINYVASSKIVPTPEPTSLALLGVGLLGIGFVANRRRHTSGA